MTYRNAIVGWTPETVLKLGEHGQLMPACTNLADCLSVRVHPAPIYETILYLGVFTILWSMRKTSYPPGRVMYWYMVLAGAARFIVEFVRINPRVFYGLSEAQLIAIGMMIVGGVALLITREKGPAESGQQPGEKDPRPAMKAVRA
jgi:prolipoprotein diacylglyceryltransferase